MSAAIDPPYHPNRLLFQGILTRLDEPSDQAPCGARNHRVILTTAAAQDALPSLLGMAVAFKATWDGHDARQKCGIFTAARIEGQDLLVEGYIFDNDLPEVSQAIRSMDMGMSWEMLDASIDDMRAEVWTISRLCFSGAAILLRLKAAYHATRITVDEPRPRRRA